MSDYLPGKLLIVDENENEIGIQGTISLVVRRIYTNE